MKNEFQRNEELYLKSERSQPPVNMKNKKQKKTDPKKEPRIVRVIFKDREIGRLETKYENIMYNLLLNNYICVEARLEWAPPLIRVFTVMPLKIKVYLLDEAITKPITQIIDSNTDPNSRENKILQKFE